MSDDIVKIGQKALYKILSVFLLRKTTEKEKDEKEFPKRLVDC